MTTILNYALSVGKTLGKVGPVDGKIPVNTDHGYLDFSSAPEEIKQLFAGCKVNRIGIAARPSGLLIIDLDVKSGVDGVLTFRDLNAGYPQIEYGPIQRTPSGGYHIFFQYPQGVKVPNRAGVLPGIDVRTDGFVASGGGYSWLRGHNFTAKVPPCPWWIVDVIKERDKPFTPCTYPNDPQPTDDYILNRFHFYMREAYPGNRNQAVYRFGLQLHYANVPLPLAESWGARFARECPAGNHPFTEAEAWAAIRSAYRSAKKPAWVDHGRE